MGRWRTVLLAAMVALIGCGTTVGSKQKAMELALNEQPTRGEFFEATLRVLDAHPDYVDEFFQYAQKHRPTMERFISNTVAHLHEKELAALTASYLAKDPDALYRILVETLDHVGDARASQEAIALAIEDRAGLSTRFIATRPSAIQVITESMVDEVLVNSRAADAFRSAMKARKDDLASTLAEDQETLAGMVDELMKLASTDPVIATRLIGGTVKWLDRDLLAEATAAQLAQNPAVLEEVMVRAIDQIAEAPEAQAALLEAIRARRETMVRLLLSDPPTAFALAGALVEAGVENTVLAAQLQKLLNRARQEQGVGGTGERD